MKPSILYVAIFLSGLSAGFFYSWLVTVIPGTKKVPDISYLQTMKSINKEILNPYFFIIFFGTFLLLIICTYMHWESKVVSSLLVASTVFYAGVIGVTILGNIPLNDQLEATDISVLDKTSLTEFRSKFEIPWNLFHLLRTLFALLTFFLTLATLFTRSMAEKLL